jgi:hypothetical protein
MKDASSDTRLLINDLQLLPAVLQEIEHDGQNSNPDTTCLQGLEGCRNKVATLNSLVEDLAMGHDSPKGRVRAWAALKTVGRSEKIRKFRSALGDMKGTLTLIQQRLLGSLV